MELNKLLNPIERKNWDAAGCQVYGRTNVFTYESESPRSDLFHNSQRQYGRSLSNPFASSGPSTTIQGLAVRPSVNIPYKNETNLRHSKEHFANLQASNYVAMPLMHGGRNPSLSASSASSNDSYDSSSTIQTVDHYGRSASYDHGYHGQYIASPPAMSSPDVSQPMNSLSERVSPSSDVTNFNTPSMDPNDISGPPRCSYCNDCQTKSPLRKVVSHIFGRNKAETRAIPKNVWVYYCRKHYQRSRYRNPKGFAVLQCELVRRQIARLEAWDGVENWSVKVRQPKGGKKPEASLKEESDDDAERAEESFAGECGAAADSNSAAGREWLLRYEGENKSMAEIKELIHAIETNVDANGGTFPDVELLPHCYPNPAEEEHDENAWMKESHRRKNGPRGSSGRKVRNKGGALAALETKHKRKASTADSPLPQMDGTEIQKRQCMGEGVTTPTLSTFDGSRRDSAEALSNHADSRLIHEHPGSFEDSNTRRSTVLVYS